MINTKKKRTLSEQTFPGSVVFWLHVQKGVVVMKSRDVKDVVYEALAMYVDEISAIRSVRAFPECEEPSNGEELELVLMDGDKYRLLLTLSRNDM